MTRNLVERAASLGAMAKQAPKPDPKPAASTPQGPKKVSVKAVVTGGAGHFGFALGQALAKSGTSVILYDVNKPLWAVPPGVVFVQVSVQVSTLLHWQSGT